MGWSQIINTDVYQNAPSTILNPSSQRDFGWTQSLMKYKGIGPNNQIAALRVSPLIYTSSSIFKNNNILQPHQHQKALGYYYTSPKKFSSNKVYQFNTILINYLQVGSGITAKKWKSPPLYMVTPLGNKSELLSNETFDNDNLWRNNGDSDTYVFPWAFFDSDSSLNILDSNTSTGRIFTYHYYSSPSTDKISLYSQSPTTYYSNFLFGNSHTDSAYFNEITNTNYRNLEYKENGKLLTDGTSVDGEGIVSHSVNETNWMVQGFSYVSLFTKDSNNNPTYITKPWNLGGNLFGNGWYVLPNSYVWYDRPESTTVAWQENDGLYNSSFGGTVGYKNIAYKPYRNMPVGGPWSDGSYIDFPNFYQWMGWDPDSVSTLNSPPPYNTSIDGILGDYLSPNPLNWPYPGGKVNNGSALNGTVKSPHSGFRKNNYIARYINQDKFNLSFSYQNDRNDNTGIKFYLSSQLPSQSPENSILIATSSNKIIQDWSSVTDIINVEANSNNSLTSSDNLKEIRVTLNLNHTWDGDLIINLKGPNNNIGGGVINLFNKEKGNSDNFSQTVFSSDDSKKSIYYGTAPFRDTFKMKKDIGVGYSGYRSNTKDIKKLLNGNSIVGNWTLYIKDDASLDTGKLNSWSIEFLFDDTSNKNYIGVLTQSTATQSYNFYGLQGNQYIIFVADKIPSTVSGTYTVVTLQNLNIEESYHTQNNTIVNVGTNSITGNFYRNNGNTLFLPNNINGNYSYQATVGVGNTLNATQSLTYSIVHTRAGTGRFTSGIWEDGNWVNGWREDKNIYQFFNVDQFFSYNRDKKWRFSIIGPSYYVSKFVVGDKVSISNIVAIDINEERKLVKNYFTVINKTVNTLILEFEFDFPLRRIERDSEFHFINVSKNIWLNGNFFNGYFSGIWTNGLFYGYPFITEMYDSHWIDGKFTGGHFKSNVISLTFSNSTNLYNNQYLNIEFGMTHSFNTGDDIYINEFVDGTPSVLFGDATVTNIIDNKSIKTSLLTNNDMRTSTFGYGIVSSGKNTGLMQNVDFDSLNISKVTSNESLDDRSVFSYNSWIDVVFDETSASNILKPQTNVNGLYSSNDVYYSRNNLYGYISNDILSSNSKFRDSFSTSYRSYKFGTKYKIFHDYIGDSSYFDDYFSSNSQTFKDLGWKYNIALGSFVTFSRTIETTSNPLISGKELKVNALYDGGVLNLSNPVDEIPNRYTEKIKQNRYTMVEFDLITKDVYEDFYLGVYSGNNYIPNPMEQPMLHFGNLNIIDRKLVSPTTTTSIDSIIYPTYLPVYKNINHVFTPNKTKFEYFYNKRDLMMTFRGSGNDGMYPSEYIIDNLKLYEVDMIPFFKYFTYENINRTVQLPIESLRPYRKYEDSIYKFVSVTPKNYTIENDNFTPGIRPDNINTIFNRTQDNRSF